MLDATTIDALLTEATALLEGVSATPRLDAEVLLAHCLDRNRTYLFAWPERTPTDEQVTHFRSLTARRSAHTPLAHLTEAREFWSLDFRVTRDTLVPRPDTELLVELAIDCLRQTRGPVLDLGTGTGVVAVCIASEFPDIRVDAADSSSAALKVAQFNADHHQTAVNFVKSDWFSKVNHRDYRLIVSNPPYLAADDEHLTRDGLQHEPRAALVAGDDGLDAIKQIINQAENYSGKNAAVMIEHGHKQGSEVRSLMQKQGFQQVTTHRDIESRERVTLGRLNK